MLNSLLNFHRLATSICLAGSLLACGGPSEQQEIPADTGFAEAFYHDDCAPWDGFALTLLLTQEGVEDVFDLPYPHLRVTSYQYPPSAPGAIIGWEGEDHTAGTAVFCVADSQCEVATAVWARLAEVDVLDELMGEIRVEFADAGVIGGPFRARKLLFQALCG